jgi:hypothetical protein
LHLLSFCRCCLCALKHHNPRNAAEILSSLRSSDALARDYYKLKDALALLDEAPFPALTGSSTSAKRALDASSCAATTGSKAAARAKAAARELLLDRVCEEARREVAAAAVQVADAVEQEVLCRKIRCAALMVGKGLHGVSHSLVLRCKTATTSILPTCSAVHCGVGSAACCWP